MRCLTPNECAAWRAEFSSRRQWKRQVTCETPKSLGAFTADLTALLWPFEQALVVVDNVVFEVPPKRQKFRQAVGETRSFREAPGHLFLQDESEKFRSTLEILLGEWIDLHAVFSPARHAVVADHDEYTTFFSESPGMVAEVREAWKRGGMRIVDYAAQAP